MTEKDIKNRIKTLRSIRPDEGFVMRSRHAILFERTASPRVTFTKRVFSRSVQVVFSTALAALFFLVLALGNPAGPLKNLFLPSLEGVGQENLLSEADTIVEDINIKLSEINYFDRSVALADDEQIILSEYKHATSEAEIDRLLQEVIEY